MIGDKYAVSVYFDKENEVSISCKSDKELEEVLKGIESSTWFRAKDYRGDAILIQTSNITYLRVNEFMVSTDDDDDEEQDGNYVLW